MSNKKYVVEINMQHSFSLTVSFWHIVSDGIKDSLMILTKYTTMKSVNVLETV